MESPLLVDIHTHIYPPSYISFLTSRTIVPYIHKPSDGSEPPRLIILPTDDTPTLPPERRGRPIDDSYTSIDAKLGFMKQHGIRASVLSLANPWLDFLPPTSAAATASAVNDDMNAQCAAHPGKLFFFAALPVSAPVDELVAEVRRLRPHLRFCRGVILGTAGRDGRGLDDDALEPLWAALAAEKLPAFIHPHYGLPKEVFGDKLAQSGHVMPLALGFPLETTIAFVRMYLAGVFARHADLRLILAHAGGAVPFLAGRLESCVRHERCLRDQDGKVRSEFQHGIWATLRRNVWLDGVVYSDVGVKAAAEAIGGWERVLWGTDHPFFPPIGEEAAADGDAVQWESVKMNVEAAKKAFAEEKAVRGVLGENAVKLLDLDL